jgi:hypothetical protein
MGAMARRVRRQLVAAVLLLFVALAAQGGVIASYSFDDDDLATGPDTFAVFEGAKGEVRLATDVRHSGSRSVLLADAAHDHDFPEVQGYFDKVEGGTLRFRFALLVATPQATLNIALAGPQHFSLEKDGIAFWLKTHDGWLCHVSDGIPKKLFRVQPFTWYLVDARLDIDAGTIDLRIEGEGGGKPLVDLTAQPNATNSPGSALWMYSFAGDVLEDLTAPRFYIDDVALATSGSRALPPFAAPGRRQLFIDRWRDAQKSAATHKGCPPVIGFDDVGTSATDLAAARTRIAQLNVLCAQIDSGNAAAALHALDAAAVQAPRAPAYRLASIIALTRLGRWPEAELRWAALGPVLRDDLRYGSMAALLGAHRNEWADAESWLQSPAESLAGDFRDDAVRRLWSGTTDEAIRALHASEPSAWRAQVERKLIAEEYYFVLLWRGDFVRAARYAERVAARLETLKVDASAWRERAGDALLLDNQLDAARHTYEALDSWSATEKLADIAYLRNDAEGERRLREKLYGSLR